MKKKTILVTGGAGFIGSYVNKQLNQIGYNTVVIDNLSKGDRRAVTRGIFVKEDILNSLDPIFNSHEIDAVMHFAASLDVGESVADPGKYYKNNVAGTLNLLDAMRRNGVNKLIFSSTAAVYGIPETTPVTESHPTAPINPYGETKLMMEKILRDYSNAYGLNSISFRYFNAAGGDPDHEVLKYGFKEFNLIPLALSSLLKNTPVTIFGTDYPTADGTCIRDYIHIHDLSTAHILGLEQLLGGGKSAVYNLGNGKGFSVREVLATVEEVTGKKLEIIEGGRRPGDPAVLIAGSEKAEKELGWKRIFPELPKMVADAWNCIAGREAFTTIPKTG